jgi:hypothetical protein
MVYDLLMEIGDTFGKWTVISLEAPKYSGHIQVRVQCECGTKRAIPRSYLIRDGSPSRQCQWCARKACAAMRFGSRNTGP